MEDGLVVLLLSETNKKKKRRIWRKKWIASRDSHGSSFQAELDANDPFCFRRFLPMTREEFDLLLGLVEPYISKRHTRLRRAITARERLAVTLRFLATGETFRTLHFHCRIGASTISNIITMTCKALYRVMKDAFLKIPATEAEWKEIAHDFLQRSHLPHCLGALEGRSIPIQLPYSTKGSVSADLKRGFSVAFVAVADAQYKFIYANVDTLGRASDEGPFACSDLRVAMDRGLLHTPAPEPLSNSDITMPYMFVGDEAFPLRPDLMKPYPLGQMDQGQRVFNYRLSRARRVVENAFGILANRFRVFRSAICLEPDKVEQITMTCLCLHNFLLERNLEAYAPPTFVDWEDSDHRLVNGTWREQGMGALQPARYVVQHRPSQDAAEHQRDLLKDYFVSPAGSIAWQEQYM